MTAFLDWTVNYGSYLDFYIKLIGYVILVSCALCVTWHFAKATQKYYGKVDNKAPHANVDSSDVSVEKFVD